MPRPLQAPRTPSGLPPVLLALAQRYDQSKAGREGTGTDFLADFRDLLTAAASTDGEARVRAAEDLRRAEHESGGLLGGPVAVSGTDLEAAAAIRCAALACLTVENESVFRELAKRNPQLLLIHTSFPGAATRHLLSHLPAALPCYHFGDADPAGFDILRDLREKTRRPFQALGMHFRPNPAALPLTAAERKAIGRLLASPVLADVHANLQAMLDHGTKGDFEQESLGQAGLRLVDACFGNALKCHAPNP